MSLTPSEMRLILQINSSFKLKRSKIKFTIEEWEFLIEGDSCSKTNFESKIIGLLKKFQEHADFQSRVSVENSRNANILWRNWKNLHHRLEVTSWLMN